MNTRLILTKVFGATALLPLVILTAHADTLLTFERETSGSMQMGMRRPGGNGDNNGEATTAPAVTAAKQTATVMMKGAKARVEFRAAGAAPTSTPTKVLLYDTDAQKVYTLDPAAKTYFAQSYKQALEGERDTTNAQQGGMASRMSFTGDVDVKAARENSAYVTKDIGGVTAKRYDLSGSIQMSFNGGQGGPGGGGFGRGNRGGQGGTNPGGNNYQNNQYNSGYSNGGFRPISYLTPQQTFRVVPQQGQQGQRPQFTPPSFNITGQIWLTPNLPLGSTRDIPAAAVYQLMLPDNTGPIGATLIKSFVAKMNSLKTIPSESTVAMGMQFGQGNANAQTPDIPPFSTHLTLTSQKTDAVLDDALFALPTDYKEIEMPRQGFGGRGQGGPRGQGGGRGNRRGGNSEQQ